MMGGPCSHPMVHVAHNIHCGHRVALHGTWPSSEMTLNYQMIVERYPNTKEWLAARFPDVNSSLYLMETSQVVKHPHVFQKRNSKKNKNKTWNMTLVRYHPKLPDDNGKVPKSNGVNPIPSCEIISILDGN